MTMRINGFPVCLTRDAPGRWRATVGVFGNLSINLPTAFEGGPPRV